jgi:hypothetical protein
MTMAPLPRSCDARRVRRAPKVPSPAVSCGTLSFEANRFKKLLPDEYVCQTWFERDRAHIRLETPMGRVVFELWDDDLGEALDDGLLTCPRTPRPSDQDWLPHAHQYAVNTGLIRLP